VWDDILPALDHETWRANLARIAAAMAEEGGTAHLQPRPPDESGPR